MLESAKLNSADGRVFYRPKGCKRCNNTGYKGRMAIYEVMQVSEAIERLVVERATTDEIKKVAVQQGMNTLRQDGIIKARAGKTSLQEVLRVSM
jgi:type IV pilus assembly protein PilB